MINKDIIRIKGSMVLQKIYRQRGDTGYTPVDVLADYRNQFDWGSTQPTKETRFRGQFQELGRHLKVLPAHILARCRRDGFAYKDQDWQNVAEQRRGNGLAVA
jgi:hypothetical protein